MLFLLQEHAAESGGGPASPFEVNFGLFLWTWVVFAILLYVLYKFAWPGILKATEEREKKVRDQLAEAERVSTEAKAMLAEAEKQRTDARNTAQQLLAEAKAAVDKERAAAVDKVRQEQEAVMARTRLDIATERDKAIADLRREAVDLALAAASKVIERRLDSDADKKIVLDYLSRVETE